MQQLQRATRAAPRRGCAVRHLANGNELHVSGSDSYALLFLLSAQFNHGPIVFLSFYLSPVARHLSEASTHCSMLSSIGIQM